MVLIAPIAQIVLIAQIALIVLIVLIAPIALIVLIALIAPIALIVLIAPIALIALIAPIAQPPPITNSQPQKNKTTDAVTFDTTDAQIVCSYKESWERMRHKAKSQELTANSKELRAKR